MFLFKKQRYFIVLFMAIPFLVAFAARYNTNDGLQNLISSIPNQWKGLLDPKTDVFWREGNHIPDSGFLILAKTPTLENAKFWLLRNELKAKRLQEIFPLVKQAQEELVHQGLMEDRYNMVGVASRRPTELYPTRSGPSSMRPANSLEYFFLFSSKCPHCKNQATSLVSLPHVIPLQVNRNDGLHNWPGLPASQYASSETIAAYAKDGRVPVLLIFDQTSKRMKILKGTQPLESIILESSNVMKIGGTNERK